MTNRIKLNRLSDDITGGPRMIAVASGKGGVGKSVISFNLAERASDRAKTLLVDADFTMGNLHLLANVSPPCAWQSVCTGDNTMADAIVSVSDNLDLLASAVGRPEQMLPDIHGLARFLGEVSRLEAYDLVIIDTASGVLPHTNLILGAVDEVILVTTPELTAISDNYALYKILMSNSPKTATSLLVNRGADQEDIDYIYQKFTAITGQFLGCSPGFFGSLSEDSRVVDAVAHQASLAQFAPDSDLFRQLARLAEHLDGRTAADQTLETTNLNPAGADIRE